MATKTHTAKRAVVQASKPRLSVMPEMANEDVDCLHIMEEAMKFFLRRAVEASDEKVAKKFARDAHRRLKHWLDTTHYTIGSGVKASICATSSRLKRC